MFIVRLAQRGVTDTNFSTTRCCEGALAPLHPEQVEWMKELTLLATASYKGKR